MVTLKHLRYYVALVQFGSQSKAAEQLYVTRQTISNVMRELEDELKTELFEPDKPSLSLTPAGKYLYEKSLIQLQEFDKLLFETRTYSNQRFTISLNVNILALFPEIKYLILEYIRQNPQIRIDTIESGNQDDILKTVKTGVASCAIIQKLTCSTESDLWSIPLMETPVYALLSLQHPLSCCHELTYAQILDYPIIGYGSHSDFYSPLQKIQSISKNNFTFINEPQTIKASHYMINDSSIIMLSTPFSSWLSSYPHIKMIPVQDATWTIELIGKASGDDEQICMKMGKFIQQKIIKNEIHL